MGIPLTLSQVPAQTPYIQYISASSQTVFPYPFVITQDSDLVVVVNGVTLNTDQGYTLSGQGNPTGGNVTFSTGQSAGAIITLFRDIPIARITQIAQNSGFSSTAFNAEFNNIYLLLQQLSEAIGFCLQVPNTNNPAPTTILTPANYAGTGMVFDSHGNPQPGILSSTVMTRALLGQLLFPQTTAESNAGVTPTNMYIPDHATLGGWANVLRYGAVGNGATNDLTAFQSAHSVLTHAGGGRITGPTLTYLLGGTLAITGANVSIDFQAPGFSYTTGNAAILYSTTNLPIVTFDTNTSNGNGMYNVNVVGGVIGVTFTASVGGGTTGTLTSAITAGSYQFQFSDKEVRTVTVAAGGTSCSWTGALSAGTITTANVNTVGGSQVGVRLGNTSQVRVEMRNVGIFNCGLYGLQVVDCYDGLFDNLYVQACASVGIYQGANCGANLWTNCSATFNASAGWDLNSTNGSDTFIKCVAEQNQYGVAFEPLTVNQVFVRLHTEHNVNNSVLFKATSNYNVVDFEQQGSGGETILNLGGTQNYCQGYNTSTVLSYPKPYQIMTTSLAYVTGSSLTATPASTAIPTNAQGKQIGQVTVTVMNVGDEVIVEADGTAAIGTSGTMTIFLTNPSGTCIAARAITATGGSEYQYRIRKKFTATAAGSNTFSLYISSSTASDSVTHGVASGEYGGVDTGVLSATCAFASS